MIKINGANHRQNLWEMLFHQMMSSYLKLVRQIETNSEFSLFGIEGACDIDGRAAGILNVDCYQLSKHKMR